MAVAAPAAEYLRAFEVRWSQARLDQYNLSRPGGTAPRKIDWHKARLQKVTAFRFSLPLGLLVLASLIWVVRFSFDARTYFILVAAWLAFAPVLRLWWIRAVVGRNRVQLKEGKTSKDASRRVLSTGSAVRLYMAWGLQNRAVGEKTFIGLLRFLNPFAALIGFRWMRLRLLRPLIACTFYAFIWPLSMPIAAFYLTRELDNRAQLLKPEWAPGHAQAPRSDEGVIRDTPGDAAASGA